MLVSIKQPDFRNHGRLQFITGYMGGGATSCVHLTREEYAERIRAKIGKGKLVEQEGVFFWELPKSWKRRELVAHFEREIGPGRLTEHQNILQWEPAVTQEAIHVPILAAQVNKGLPPRRKLKGGAVNVVLALWNRKNYCQSNQYIPRWQVVNTAYYHANPHEFDGWIDLEDQETKPIKKS